MLLQRTEVGFPAFTWWLIIISNSSSRGPDTLFRPLQAPGTHVIHIYKHRQNTHKIKNSKKRKKLTPNPVYLMVSPGLYGSYTYLHIHNADIYKLKHTSLKSLRSGVKMECRVQLTYKCISRGWVVLSSTAGNTWSLQLQAQALCSGVSSYDPQGSSNSPRAEVDRVTNKG